MPLVIYGLLSERIMECWVIWYLPKQKSLRINLFSKEGLVLFVHIQRSFTRCDIPNPFKNKGYVKNPIALDREGSLVLASYFIGKVKLFPKTFASYGRTRIMWGNLFLKDFIYILLERGEGREKEERNIHVREKHLLVASCTCPEPATQAGALTRNRTSSLSFRAAMPSQLSHTGQSMRNSWLLVQCLFFAQVIHQIKTV